ncbi:MAG: hypothetical protein HC906_15510 [Bacteroidales bacterium]|nr:hypothetical protein [Bacteroidales bacterium]
MLRIWIGAIALFVLIQCKEKEEVAEVITDSYLKVNDGLYRLSDGLIENFGENRQSGDF